MKKKLMLLGGSAQLLPVIEAAHRLGLYVITCDYLPANKAHQYADEYVNISVIDKEKVLATAKKRQIDGIMSFGCDPGVVTAAYVAEMLGLPNVGPYESVCILQNKGKFRRFLSENGFTVPAAKCYRDTEEALKDAGGFPMPVIVKPVDSAGSKGVSRAEGLNGLKKSMEYAKAFSLSGDFIIEEYIPQQGFSSDSDCFFVDGELKFVSFNCQYFDPEAGNPYVPSAYSWPAAMNRKHQEELKSEFLRLFRLLDMKTAVCNIETRAGTDGKAYIMEFSPRGGGNKLSECLQHATGVDLITNMIRYSVGIPMEEIVQKPYNGHWCEIILHSNRSGTFKDLWISEEIKAHVQETALWIEKGERLSGFRGANEAVGALVLKMDSPEEVEKVLSNQSRYVRVIVE